MDIKNIEYCVIDPNQGRDGKLVLEAIACENMLAANDIVKQSGREMLISFTREEMESFVNTFPKIVDKPSNV